jgi:SAM-dependent methyltransferase
MHETSLLKMQAFRDTYLVSASVPLRVLDIGSAAVEGQFSYRTLFEGPSFEYSGADLAPGFNVDVVLEDPHRWIEIATSSIDVVISGQMLEHDPYFWVTVGEIGRVLRPGGWCCIVAPSRGPAHFYPLDCWRFYPDAGAALMTFGGMEVLETWVEPGSFRSRPGVEWGDNVTVGRLPEMDESSHRRHLERLSLVAATLPERPLPHYSSLRGPAMVEYERMTRSGVLRWRPYLLRKSISHVKWYVWNSASPRWRSRLTRLRSGAPS